ncbi:hypothetical protein GG344DRAFT_69483 [Lentinula edodes]|nr:hypothetical protein GG344DRAFT_69483 [Lentinula edodes]
MVLSRIIISALLAFGSITVALPVVPGDVAGTTPKPGSSAPLPHLQGSLAVGDTAVPLEDGVKGVSPLVGGPSSPHGNAAGSSISRRQGQGSSAEGHSSGSSADGHSSGSSADGRLSIVPSLEQLGNHLPSSEDSHIQEYINRMLLRKMDVIKKYPDVHRKYKAIVARLSSNMEKAPETLDHDDYLDVIEDSEAVTTLASVIELYMPPNKGMPGDSRQKIRRICRDFKKGHDPGSLEKIIMNQ